MLPHFLVPESLRCEPRRFGHSTSMVRLLAVALASITVGAAQAGNAISPSLKIEHASPLVVRGLNFHARESVTVTAPAGRRMRIRTTATGGFLATFPQGDRCSGGQILARGAAGDQAILRLPPMMCLPAKGVPGAA